MLCEPGFSVETSSVPEFKSSTTDRAVSKLLFMVVAITPVGPVFNQPLQYRPRSRKKMLLDNGGRCSFRSDHLEQLI